MSVAQSYIFICNLLTPQPSWNYVIFRQHHMLVAFSFIHNAQLYMSKSRLAGNFRARFHAFIGVNGEQNSKLWLLIISIIQVWSL